MTNLKVTDVSVHQLKASEYNPRKLPPQAEADLTESIKRFGLIDPIIVNSAKNRSNIVIGGHQRLKIAKKLNHKTIPVVYVDLPDVKKEKELNLRLNRNTGQWDYELLKEFDIDLLLDVGFDDNDLSAIWDQQLAIEDDNFDSKKEASKIKKPSVKTGDLVKLGRHYLFCGDSTKLNDVKQLVSNHKINMVYSDPPFNINLDYNKGVSTNGKYGGSKVQDNKSDQDYKSFLLSTLENTLAVIASNAHIFYYCDQNYIWLLQQLYDQLGIKPRRVCLWVKNNFNPTPSVAFNKAYEPCVYGTVGSPYLDKNETKLSEVLNRNVATGNRLPDDILDIFSIWLAKRKAAQDYLTPTEKPVTLHEKPLRRCSKPGDKILDLFGGSGSTLIACEQLKRQAFLMEIDPVFCQVIINRYKQLTGREVEYVN